MPKKSSSLKRVQLKAFIISFFIPSFILICLLFISFINKTQSFQKQEQKNTLELLSAHLAGNINSDLVMSLSYIFDNDILYFYNMLDHTPIEDNLILYNQYLQPYSKTLNSYMTLLNKNIVGMGFIPCHNNTDKYFYMQKYNALEIKEYTDYKNSGWYLKLQKNSSSVIFTKNNGIDRQNVISLIRVAKNVDKKQNLGYIVIDISMDFIYSLLDQLSIGKNSGILLLSPTGEFLFSTNADLSEHYKLLTKKTTVLPSKKDTYDIYSYTDKSNNFTFYYLSSRKDLYGSYLVSLWLVLFFYLLMMVSVYYVFHFTSRKISGSIDPILQVMAKYNAGEAEIQCDTDLCSISEIKTISENLNIMIQNINDHIQNEYKLQISQKIAEYQALQAEIDPHFLYNILNLFITLNRINERNQLENAIINLSHLFRYTCEHTTVSTINKEFSFIKDYLSLQQIRYDDRLSFQIFVEPGLEDFEIPKLLIQPLIENAIVHSLEPSDKKIMIQLTAIKVKNKFGYNLTVISVINTGLPFIASNSSPKRVGIQNVEERLKLFNPKAFFVMGGGIEKPTKCYIIIPIELK
ncbi:two-component system, sensor histidine kinase YesM [Anaerocolumna jejuensis DSM 15929]|uniref:Two-component system, sensor histidine kinase YesM n=1 Tax=Anaerocolumna jejuensis DSM 15929 TaxID=1121322 RepID=A0A1M6XGX5_9FIRM|nr:sensor histidine kinase [Anaerocolumna jejuensis]SHL05217.1 two-component system, sensor histidine kinase YesM [Anaerocolumna jejuensis DSM 15929]